MNPATRLAPVLVALAACTVGPDYRAPEVSVPDHWVAPAADGSVSPDGAWWRSFDDAILTGLIERAVRTNTDVRVAVARLREARAFAGGVGADGLPQVGVHASYSNSQFSENGFLKELGAGSDSGVPGAAFPGQKIDLHEVGFDASWELDLFGGVRRAEEAADADVGAAASDLRAVLVSLLAEVAQGYFELRGLQERLELAQRTAAAQQDTADVVAEQVAAGIADELDLSRAKTLRAAAAARVPELEAQVHAAMRRLETLLDVMPGTLDGELREVRALPALPEALAAGIPSDVVRRRPDVQAAERRLAAATARIGVATADLFPRFSLTGSFGVQSQRLDELPESDSIFWLVGPAVRWPILDFGRIRANIDVHDARAEQALARYEGTVLRALSDVEVALVRLARDRRRQDDLAAARDASQRSVELADEQYRNGVLEFLDLLDAQRSLILSADAVAQGEQALATDVVALFKALGGGWQALEG